MVSNEKSFPRGGIANLQANVDISTSNVVFGATTKRIKKAPKAKEAVLAQTENDTGEQLQAFSAESLTFDTLQEHMLVMGVVKAADATSLQIALPGRLSARALVSDISEAYARVAQSYMEGDSSEYRELSELFSVGSIVYGRTIKTEQPERNRTTLTLTLKPADVNSNLKHTNIKKGFIFSGAVQEVQEHGCVIETGIDGLQAFMANEEGEGAQPHHVGQLIFVKVKKIQHTDDQSTCQCVQLEQSQLKIKSNNETNLDYILPGSIVKFKVIKHIKNGLEGSIMNESFRGYVNEHHLSEALLTPQDYELNMEYMARVLYIMPLTKLVYLTLNLDITVPDEHQAAEDDEEKKLLKKGTIVEKARVVRHGTGGIVLLLHQKFKGLISYSSIKLNFKGNYDQDVILTKYSRKSKHTVRVLGYDVIEALYYCTDDPNVLNEKQYTLEDLQCGDIVTARIIKPDSKIGGYCVKIGKVNGIIEQLLLAPNVRYEVGQRLRCRVLDICLERKICYLSNRNEYLNKNAKLLTTMQAAQTGSLFTGTVVKSDASYVLVKFCGGIKGVLHKQRLNSLLELTFFEGQTTKFRIAARKADQIVLTLPEDNFQLGEICPIEVTNALDAGLEIKIAYASDEQDTQEDFAGMIPTRMLSDYIDLQSAQKRVHPVGTKTEAACILQNIFSLRDVPYFSGSATKDWQTVQVGDILRAHVKHVEEQVLELLLPVRNYNKLVKLHVKMLCLKTTRDNPVSLSPDQLLYVKILSKESETKTLTVSAKLTDVWSGQLADTAKLVESYLKEVQQLRKSLQVIAAPIAKHAVGDKIQAVFKGIDPATNNWIYSVAGTNITALLVASIAGTATAPAVGSEQQAVILWIDYADDLLLISNRNMDIEHISNVKQLPSNLIGKAGMKAKVLLKLDTVVVCSLKKGASNPLIICPIRLHPNDVENSASACLRQGDFCNLALIHDKLPIAVPETVWKLWKNIKRVAVDEAEQVTVKSKKMKLESSLATKRVSSADAAEQATNLKAKKVKLETKLITQNGIKSPTVPLENGKSKKCQLFFEDKNTRKTDKVVYSTVDDATAKARLPGISSFWESDPNTLNGEQTADVTSDEEDEDDADTAKSSTKKKRLSSKEKVKVAFKEEKRLRAIETRNADPNQQPETIDQFERLVLSEPNSSRAWIQYMSFLLSTTEIDKAREIALRATKTISFREAKELRNVWIALINLELTYNSANVDDVLKDALSHNDPLEIHLSLVEVFKSHGLKERLTNTLNVMTRKFKTELQVWRVAAGAHFWLGLSDRVQPMLQRALNALPKNQHINCIVAFAKLYAQHDQNAMAQTLLDDVVTSYPKRIDIWVLYVDMLVKCNLIEPARHVLERAVLQKLQPDKMLVIYKKYLDFEEKHGTESTAARVKQLAEQYVQGQIKVSK